MPILPIGKDCCGCSACESACNYNALYLKLDDEGFHRPFINENCVECKCCEVACPNLPFLSGTEYDKVKNKSKFKANTSINEVYAIKAKDKELVTNSSSGGVFSLLAEQVLASGGVVFGAAFDENFDVKHIKVTDKNELYRLRTSKYVESYLGRTFEEVLKELKAGKKVLFSGVQCQVHGLNSFLKKPYENLLSVEVICNSIPSVKIWHIYKGYLEQKIGKLTSFNFRDISKTDWNNYCIAYGSRDRQCKEFHKNNAFMRGFLQHKITRESCAECKAKNGASGADITLGDFWNIGELHPEFVDNKGVSLVIVHSHNGIDAINSISNLFEIMNSDINKAIKSNPSLVNPLKINPKRTECIAKIIQNSSIDIVDLSVDELANKRKLAFARGTKMLKELTGSVDVAVLTYSDTVDNYGQVLQLYALQKYLKIHFKDLSIKNYECGDVVGKPRFIVYFNENEIDITEDERIIRKNYNKRKKAFDDFRAKYITFERTNFGANAVIVGSDQVWNDWYGFFSGWRKRLLEGYTLGYLKDKNPVAKKISYAASFGKHEFSEELSEFFKEKLSDFDAISVREKENIENLKEWGLNGQTVPDPTMLFSKKEWSSFSYDYDVKDKIFAYMLRVNDTFVSFDEIFSKIAEPVEKVYASCLKNIQYCENTLQLSPQEWIGAIKNSRYVITNSYHAAVFSIILNKPFFLLALNTDINKAMDNSRFETLVKEIGLEDFLISDISQFDTRKFTTINWQDVNNRLEKYRQIGIEFLQHALKDFAMEEMPSEDIEVKNNIVFEDGIKNLEILNTIAKEIANNKVQNYLSYKLGSTMINKSKSLLGIATMPFALISIALNHKNASNLTNKVRYYFPAASIYIGRDEENRLKNHLSYKLGFALIKGSKTWYKGGIIKFIFEAIRLQKEHKKTKK